MLLEARSHLYVAIFTLAPAELHLPQNFQLFFKAGAGLKPTVLEALRVMISPILGILPLPDLFFLPVKVSKRG